MKPAWLLTLAVVATLAAAPARAEVLCAKRRGTVVLRSEECGKRQRRVPLDDLVSPGPKGDPGEKGDKGEKGDTGDPGPPGSPIAPYMKVEALSVPASGALRQAIECDPGDLATGGGYFLNTATLVDAQLNVEVFTNSPITSSGNEGTGWDIGIRNKTTTARTGFGYAVCAALTP